MFIGRRYYIEPGGPEHRVSKPEQFLITAYRNHFFLLPVHY
jgi:hypothetical protein